jgi:hypothetical protein
MTKLEEVGRIVSEFLKQTLNVKDVRIVKAAMNSDGWETEAEVYEESSFIKSLGLPTRVLDRIIYSVKVNSNLEIESYEREGQARLTE